MFQLGEYVAHYKDGVCEVVGIGPLQISSSSQKKEYYTLKPVYNKAGTVYTPVDNEKQIRALLSKTEAQVLLDRLSEIENISVPDEKRREACYKEALYKNDCVQWAAILKTAYLRKKHRLASGKKSVNVDEKYLSNAEKFLYGELAIVLEKDKDTVKELVLKQLNE